MQIKEIRIVLPLDVKEYQVAQLYTILETSKNETGGGEGVEVVKNEPFENLPFQGGKYSRGQYTYKIYHLGKKVPAFVRWLAPSYFLEVHEEAWNAYPYCKTVIFSPKARHRGNITIESFHHSGAFTLENPLELSKDKLKQRKVVNVDIANDPISKANYIPDADPKTFKSVKTGRGPLIGPRWWEECEHVMTCYKVVTCSIKWFGIQRRLERFVLDTETRLFRNFHRRVFCYIDKWYGMTMDEIRQLEKETKRELDRKRIDGPRKGQLLQEENDNESNSTDSESYETADESPTRYDSDDEGHSTASTSLTTTDHQEE